MPNFIFELVSEEIPASYQASAVEQFQKIEQKIVNIGLIYDELKVFATPRRLILYIKNLPDKTPCIQDQIFGPAQGFCFDEHGVITKALKGFLHKNDLLIENIVWQKKDEGGTEYATASVTSGGELVKDILPSLISETLLSIKFPKIMRWSDSFLTWSRPILGAWAIWDKDFIAFPKNDFFSKVAQRSPSGHFIFSENDLSIESVEGYLSKMKKLGIIIDPFLRQKKLHSALLDTANKLGLELVNNKALLSEVNYLIEYVHVIHAEFAKYFLDLPEIVILSEMEKHQRYFALRDIKSKKISNKFLICANVPPFEDSNLCAERDQNIKEGNTRVIQARLSDGVFFLNEDKKKKLINRVPDLSGILYQKGLGSMFEKKSRLAIVAESLKVHSATWNSIPEKTIKRAADLIKADLTTKLVYEFDHLQGEIGSIYAESDGELPEIVTAIREHYYPCRKDDPLPKSPLGSLFSLADKFDDLIAGFLLSKNPTSSQDPFGLRRTALSLIQIILQERVSFSLTDQIIAWKPLYPVEFSEQLSDMIWQFIKGRLITIFEKQGFNKKLIRAVSVVNSYDIINLYDKIEAIREFQKQSSFLNLMSGFKRMMNILKKSKDYQVSLPDPKLFQIGVEKDLFEFASDLQDSINSRSSYFELFTKIANIKPVIDRYFHEVMVNHENPILRKNRLATLSAVVLPVLALIDLGELK